MSGGAVRRLAAGTRARTVGRLEEGVLVAGAFLATLYAEWPMLADARAVQADAPVHEFWMRRFQAPELFGDPLTASLLDTGYSPPLFRALYWLASTVVDPVFFGELLALVLQPLAVWLVFRIVRAQVDWRPAAWIAGGLFLVPWDILRFSGGHPRAFAQPIVLLTVLLLLCGRRRAAALVPAVGLLLYPPAALTALAIVLLAALDRSRRFLVGPERALWAGIGVLGVAAAVLVTRLTTGSQEVLREAEARLYPEFGPDGQMHFFASSTLEYLRQNYSGFFLQDSGSLLAVAALLLLVVRPRNARLLRWEVWCMPIAALLLFVVAHLLLFRLYLPHRYTYPLLPFFCIAVAVCVRPTLQALLARSRAWLVGALVFTPLVALLALTVFPLGPRISLSASGTWLVDAVPYLLAGLAAGLLAAAARRLRPSGRRPFRTVAVLATAGALGASGMLAGAVVFADGARSPDPIRCKDVGLYRQLRALPADAIVAGDPFVSNCIPIAARRAVVISRKLYQPWAVDYFDLVRERMSLTVRAFYGPSVADVVALRERFGADVLVVRADADDAGWYRMEPFTSQVQHLRRSTDVPAVERLPGRCQTWSNKKFRLYDLACVASEEPR